VRNLIVRRYPYEEPYNTELVIFAANENFSGRRTGIYRSVEGLADIGRALQVFPAKMPDEYEYGYTDFSLRAYTVGRAGHTYLQISINVGDKRPYSANCTFSIKAEPAAINRLGELFLAFSKLEHLEFWWGQDVSQLFKEYQPEQEEPDHPSHQ
jgi:hypothetical protein